jgi:hypothetical protein
MATTQAGKPVHFPIYARRASRGDVTGCGSRSVTRVGQAPYGWPFECNDCGMSIDAAEVDFD